MSLAFHDLVGGLGVGLIVGSYFLVQLGRLDNLGYRYTSLNALGAALILYSLVFDFNLPAFIVELFWLLISLMGLLRLYLGSRNSSKK